MSKGSAFALLAAVFVGILIHGRFARTDCGGYVIGITFELSTSDFECHFARQSNSVLTKNRSCRD